MGRDYRQLIKDGVLDQMSIGYVAQEYDVDTNNVRAPSKGGSVGDQHRKLPREHRSKN